MSEPMAAALMLTANRPDLARKAVECFRRQTYPADRRILLILDTGKDPSWHARALGENDQTAPIQWHQPELAGKTIGELRNIIAGYSRNLAEVLIHWDDDDWSHPTRMAEQVELLQSTGADCVGYNEMLFWDSRFWSVTNQPTIDADHWRPPEKGAAWVYSAHLAPPPGTSLCYWRRTWESLPFANTSYGEDTGWINGLRATGKRIEARLCIPMSSMTATPRMIARIHGANSATGYSIESMKGAPQHWTRVPELDDVCRRICEA